MSFFLFMLLNLLFITDSRWDWGMRRAWGPAGLLGVRREGNGEQGSAKPSYGLTLGVRLPEMCQKEGVGRARVGGREWAGVGGSRGLFVFDGSPASPSATVYDAQEWPRRRAHRCSRERGYGLLLVSTHHFARIPGGVPRRGASGRSNKG